EWVHVQLHQQKGMISLSPPTICNSAFSHTPLLLCALLNKHVDHTELTDALLPDKGGNLAVRRLANSSGYAWDPASQKGFRY
ncbi:hypothetical protein ACM0DK_25020, partial [Salmonella enterica]|uniref:hypothetical protein n=1 Tax=Salmonella enterica TaxID=28901 RepID=UPI003905C212